MPPTPDSLNVIPPLGAPPTGAIGEGPSEKLDKPAGRPPLDIGGLAGGLPGGMPPKPLSPEDQAALDLNLRAAGTLVEAISKYLKILDIPHKEGISDEDLEKLINAIIRQGWDVERIEELARKMDITPKELFVDTIKGISSNGEEKAIDTLKQKLTGEGGEPKGVPTQTPPVGVPGMGGGVTPPPLPSGAEEVKQPTTSTSRTSSTDVGLTEKNFIIRGTTMGDKIVINKDGTLEKVAGDKMNGVLNNLVLAIRNARTAMSTLENEKLKYAGVVALKRAEEEMMEEEVEEEDVSEEGDDETEETDDMMDDMGEEEAEEGGEIDSEAAMAAISELETAIANLKDAIGGTSSAVEQTMDMTPATLGETEGMIGIAASTLDRARTVLKTAKADMKNLDKKCKKDKKKCKAKSKDSQAAMNAAMGTGSKTAAKKDDDKKKDKKKEDKEEKKEKEEKEDKEKKSETDDLIVRVKARLAEIRKEKEAFIYDGRPADAHVAPSGNKPLDKINTEAGNIKDIGGEPASDKDYQTINAAPIAQAALPASQGKGAPGHNTGKGTSMKEAPGRKASEDTREAIDKARLAVELAAIQQFKGLLPNPLKEAMIKNMVEAGVNPQVAEDIAHNAFIDGSESAHKILSKEAFETFMNKDYDDFVKVSAFTKDYIAKEGAVLSSVEDEETKKTASANPPLRGAKTSYSSEDYKEYWEDVKRTRRGF
jgi:hypothetical protein